MPFGWEGQKIRLAPLEKARHFDNTVRWLNDPDVTAWLLIGDFPLTRLAEEAFFERVARENEKEVVFAIELMNEEEEHIGGCGIHQIELRSGTGVIGLFIGRKQLWSRGYGTDAIATLTRYAFDVLGLRLLLSSSLRENVASIRAQQKCGYQEVGCIPQRYWKRGAYRDEILFALDREIWRAQRATQTASG